MKPDVKNGLAEDEFEADDYKLGMEAFNELKKTILEPPQVWGKKRWRWRKEEREGNMIYL